MLLISNLCGSYDSETPEGRGANAALNVIKYIEEGRKIAEENAKKLLKGEINIREANRNTAVETLSRSYIPYTEINEESGQMDISYGLAFASVYINSLDRDNDGAITVEEAGPCGRLIDQIDPNGKITKGKFLAWLVFQDCVDVYNGVISPQEAGKALLWASSDPRFVVEKLREIYNKLNLKEREDSFKVPQPVNG
jgi:hypothetical protein